MLKRYLLAACLAWPALAQAQQPAGPGMKSNRRFEQLGTELPTPNTYRAASGQPGRDYFQNTADYDIKVELDDANQRIIGSETITYTNNSPDALPYLWLQLDQNLFKETSLNALSKTGGIDPRMSAGQLSGLNSPSSVNATITSGAKQYGYTIHSVKTTTGQALPYTINGTMMRVDIPTPLQKGQAYTFQVAWDYNITEYYGRSGYEFFEKDGNYNYFIAHWFPRMCVYDDVNGWQHKQFMGRGEFTVPFGNYKVEITVPADHVVAATGECQNYSRVLTAEQQRRLSRAATSKTPVMIVTQAEAEEASKRKSHDRKQTWVYRAANVRDFAFASSRRFIWDAMQTDVYNNGRKIWSMSFYPKEGNPLWEQYSTRVVEHTLKTYGEQTFEYPYPVAISCHATAGGGMEYPMISFNGGRPEADGTYSDRVKAGMIGVIIHEVGHNFFPMIVNSDERQWSWMDEGLNSFCQFVSEQKWDRNFPSRRGEASKIVDYMKMDQSQLEPIMTNSENIIQFGPNAYSKPATALNILRETVMGRELFDYAFKEYARRWKFKHPKPADFFRTMEDASGVDLDWFWRGWFFGTEPVDQALVDVEWYALDSQNPEAVKARAREAAEASRRTITNIRNEKDIPQTVVERDSTMRDFYNSYDPNKVTDADLKRYESFKAGLSEDERKALESGMNYYVLRVKNKGGLVMPVIVGLEYEDGTSEVLRFPAEIWRLNDVEIAKTIATKKKVKQFTLDPYQEIADIDTSNNGYPRQAAQPTRFELFKRQAWGGQPNPMQQAKKSQAAATGRN